MLAMSPEVNSFDHEIEETEEILSNTAKEGGLHRARFTNSVLPFWCQKAIKKNTFFSFFFLFRFTSRVAVICSVGSGVERKEIWFLNRAPVSVAEKETFVSCLYFFQRPHNQAPLPSLLYPTSLYTQIKSGRMLCKILWLLLRDESLILCTEDKAVAECTLQ